MCLVNILILIPLSWPYIMLAICRGKSIDDDDKSLHSTADQNDASFSRNPNLLAPVET